MTTPLPLGLAPYISPTTLLTAPTGIDWSTIPAGDDITTAENMAEWWNMCGRATARVDSYCNQVVRATLDTELFHGPDFRVTVGPGGGGSSPSPYWGNYNSFNARVIASRWPVLTVTGVQTCPNNLWPRQWTTLPAGWAEPEKPPIGIYGSIAPGASGDGGQGILIGPGYINWSLGRNGWAIQVTYINGYPHCSLTSTALAGDMTLNVNDCTGWAITNYYGTYTGATGSIKDSGQQESIHVQTATATAGPGILSLTRPLAYPHPAGTLVTTMPASIEQACILFAASEALTRGATATTIHDIGGHAQSSGGDATALATEAELLIHAYQRTI